ncbi:MAG: flavodoxin family protein [Desulfotignum sp.]|jgi:multimeric flavodoxin WrbA|nr:flavodoxin family protein [Desulfotignum sp.]
MKILTLLGSARKKGNTATLLGWMEEELRSQGHEVTSIYLHGKNLNGCMGCGKCKEVPDDVGCVQKDDVPEILDLMVAADLVVFASPLYFWGVSAQLKAVIDRTYSLYTRFHEPDHASLLEGRRQALLVTGAGSWENNAEAAFTAFGRMQKPHKTIHSGTLYIGKCTIPADMDASVREQAAAFARQITV